MPYVPPVIHDAPDPYTPSDTPLAAATITAWLTGVATYADALFAAAELLARKGAANGYPALDAGAKVPPAQLPPISPAGAASGDLGSNYPGPTVLQLTGLAAGGGAGGVGVRIGGHHAIYDVAGDNLQLRSNYRHDTNRLVDTTKPSWAIALQGGAGDTLTIYRAPATAGAPAYAALTTVSAAGLLNAVGGLQSNGTAVELQSRRGAASGYPSLDSGGFVPDGQIPATVERVANKGIAGGYPSLDGSGKVPAGQLPTGTATPDASTTTKGIGRVSVAPAVASDPILVGTNDPRLGLVQPIPQLFEAWGHSFVAAAGVREQDCYAEKLSFMLGIRQRDNYGVSGSYSYYGESGGNPGGVGFVLKNLTRQESQGTRASGGSAPYPPRSVLALHHQSLNDLGSLGSAKAGPMLNAHRAIWSRICASKVWEETDGAWVFNGAGWTQTTDANYASGGAYKLLNNTTGSSAANFAQFTVPADVPAGRVLAIGIVLNVLASGTYTFGFSVNGNTQPAFSINAGSNTDSVHSQGGVFVIRLGSTVAWPQSGLGALNAWDGVIRPGDVVKVWPSAVPASSGVRVDYAQIEADPADGPLVIVPLPNREVSYALWGSSFGDADIATWSTSLQSIFPEFPNRIIGVDIDTPLGKSASLFQSDGTHPNETGHAIVAETILNAIRSSSLPNTRTLTRPAVQLARRWRPVGTGTQSVPFSGTWQNNDIAKPAGFLREINGTVRLRGLVTGGAGPPFSTIFTLPPSFRPATDQFFNIVSNALVGSPAVSTPQISQLAVMSANGDVVLNAGGTDLVSLDGVVFPAAA